jgi:hypothetical protein
VAACQVSEIAVTRQPDEQNCRLTCCLLPKMSEEKEHRLDRVAFEIVIIAP